MRKGINYLLALMLILFLGYHSVYVRKLSEVKKEAQEFDPKSYAQTYLSEKLPKEESHLVSFLTLFQAFDQDAALAFKNYALAPSEGNIRYVMARGEGVVARRDGEFTWLKTDDGRTLKLASRYIYGTAARDGAGWIAVDSFDNTMQFNEVSEEINQLIRKEVVPALQQQPLGARIHLVGAVELNRSSPNWQEAAMIPLSIQALAKDGGNHAGR